MKHIIFVEGAERDLHEIAEYYERLSQASHDAVLSDIYSAISLLSQFPNAGTSIQGSTLRRFVTSKYHFKIAYLIARDELIIYGLVRHQDRELACY